MLKQQRQRPLGLGQLSLVEHALCPLNRSVAKNLVHTAEYQYSTANRIRKTARVRVFAPLGLVPTDELYLWGLLALTLSQREVTPKLVATPHWCLTQLGLIDGGTRHGGRQYQQFAAALERLSVVNYLSDACYDPSRGEHRKLSFGFLSYSLPVNPESHRAWTIVWDSVFFDLVQASGGSMRFDLDLYRSLDAASRRLLLLVLKVGYREGRLPVWELRHLAVDVLGLSPQLALRDMKVKVLRTLLRLEDRGIVQNPRVSRTSPKSYTITFERGEQLRHATRSSLPPIPDTASPAMEGLLAIGFDVASAARLIRKYPQALLSQWIDITQAALERFGKRHFRVSPMAFLVDSLQHAAEGLRTPPDWWHEIRRQEQRTQGPTGEGRKVLSKLLDEVFGAERTEHQKTNRPESAGSLLKSLL